MVELCLRKEGCNTDLITCAQHAVFTLPVPSLSAYIVCTAAFVCQYLVDEVVLFDASNQRQRCDVQIGGLHFKHLADHDRACRRSLQHLAAMISFDTGEKKVAEMTSGAAQGVVPREKQQVDIQCKPNEVGSMVVWFRVRDASGMEFIASFSNNGVPKSTSAASIFSYTKIKENTITLLSFNKTRDSGVYSCASLKGSELKFGQVTRLIGEKAEVRALLTTAIKPSLCTTATACVCNNMKQGDTSPFMSCNPIILGPLAGSCGLLLLLLIITILYCNQIRTRRCPHHYKRQPRTTAPGKQMKTTRHI